MMRSSSLRFSRSRAVELAILCGLAFSVLPITMLRAQVPSYQNYSIERIGLFGPQQTGSAGLQTSFASLFNAPGFVLGGSLRITGIDTYNGQNAWVWNGTSTTPIGLTGAGYTGSEGYQISFPQFQNAAGRVAGISYRITGVNTNNGQNAWAWNGTVTTPIGLTGAGYTGSAGYQVSGAMFQNAAGQVAGISLRVTGVSTENGRNTWAWNGTSTTQIGLAGAAHTGSAGRQFSEPQFQNAAGQVAGYSDRIAGVNTNNGYNTWVWNGATTTLIGLTGAGYTGSAGRQHSILQFQTAAGQVAGISNRITGVSTNNGWSAWVWNGTTTRQIGLTGAANTGSAGYQYSEPLFFNAPSFVVGYSARYTGVSTDNGQNAWVWIGTTTEPIGLIGAGYTGSAGYQYSTPQFQNAAGQVAGYSQRITGVSTFNGYHAWAWNGATSIPIGFIGPGNTGSTGIQLTEPRFQNAAGQVAGISARLTGAITGNGQNAWAWNGTSTTQIGLTGASYTGSAGRQHSEPRFQNAAGQVAGLSYRYVGEITENGQNAWAWNGTTTTPIGLTGAGYTGSAGYQYSSPQFQNAAGQVAGYSNRYTGVNTQIGQNTWYFDPTTLLSSAIIGSVRTSDNFASSTPTILTEDGFLLGSYSFFAGGLGDGEQRAFIFRPDVGFTDLGNLVGCGLASSGWSTLQNPQFSDAINTIVGYGYVNGQTTGQSVFVMGPPPCVADVAGGVTGGSDGVVDGDDFITFVNAFAAGGPQADIAGCPDGIIDGNDFIAFINAFGAGC